jgi:hypothetical protein
VTLARRFRESGDKDAAGNALGFVPLLKTFDANEWAVAREAAVLLEQCGRAARALEVWATLLGTTALPRELRIAWLPEARKTAEATANFEQARTWGSQLQELTAPEKK